MDINYIESLLSALVGNDASSEILSQEDVNGEATFFVAEIKTEDFDSLKVPFIHTNGTKFLWTPFDWQERLPLTPDGIGSIRWRVDDTDTEGIMLMGLPRLSPISDASNGNALKAEGRMLIGQAIATARKSEKMTQKQLGEMCGLAQQHINRIEHGKYSVTIDTLYAIARALGKEIRLV